MPITWKNLPERLVAADLSLLRGRPRDYRVPQGVGLVIPGTIVEEVLGVFDSEPDKAIGQVAKFHDLFNVNRGRVFLGRSAAELDSFEHNPCVRLDARHWINFEFTEHLAFQLPPLDFWISRGVELSVIRDRRWSEERARRLAQHRAAWMDVGSVWPIADDVARFRRDPEHLLAVIRDPRRAAQASDASPKFASPAWIAALQREPQRYSWPRFLHLMDWYGLQKFMKPDMSEEAFRNDYDDIDYVHLASYCGVLATADSRMKECTAALFPAVRILDGLP